MEEVKIVVAEERLEGGNVGGAVRAGDTVRRAAGPWTPAVHALLAHLADKGFTGAPRPLGFDEQGREVLTFLEGETTGSRRPRPAWVHAEDTLDQVARWMRAYHQAVADFVPPPGAVWRGGGTWSPELIIAHNDAASYNAAWHEGKLTGFFDWDFAGPATPEWDLALAAFSWVPLHTRHWVAAEGFTDFAARPRRLDRFLRTYGWSGDGRRVPRCGRGARQGPRRRHPRPRRLGRPGVRATAPPGHPRRSRRGCRRTGQLPAIAPERVVPDGHVCARADSAESAGRLVMPVVTRDSALNVRWLSGSRAVKPCG